MVLWQSDLRVSLARAVAFLADSWAGCRCYFTHAPGRSVTPRYGWCYFRWWCLIAFAASGVLMLARGEIRLLMDGRLRWQGQEWSIVKAPWMIKSGMMLRLRSDGGKRQHLWLAADSMDEAEWRDLRRILLQQETQR